MLDLCNGVFEGLTKKIHETAAANSECCSPIPRNTMKVEHQGCNPLGLRSTPVIRSLHWPPVNQIINFKIQMLVFKTLHSIGIVSTYKISESLTRHPDPLRSWRTDLLTVPRTRIKQGQAAFSVCGPHLWNKTESLRFSHSVNSIKTSLSIFYSLLNSQRPTDSIASL